MNYTKLALQSDVERLLYEMAPQLESRAECDDRGEDDISISGRDSIAREYARKISDVVAAKTPILESSPTIHQNKARMGRP